LGAEKAFRKSPHAALIDRVRPAVLAKRLDITANGKSR
jgi:hypothetical protein